MTGHEKRTNLFSPQRVTVDIYKNIVIKLIQPDAFEIYLILNIAVGNHTNDTIISKTRFEYFILKIKQQIRKTATEISKKYRISFIFLYSE